MDSELDNFWNGAPKFPSSDDESKIDVDSFVQIYRDIDELFEEDDEEEAEVTTGGAKNSASKDNDDDEEDEDEQALEQVFETLCQKDELITKEILRGWDEIDRLLADGLLGDDEFETLWTKTQKSPGTSDKLDVDGFLSFNVFLDDLFVFDDVNAEDAPTPPASPNKSMVSGEDLPPSVLFAALANGDYLVGSDELQYWEELQDMLKEGDLAAQELQDFYSANAVTKGGKPFLTEETFVPFVESINNLFEEDDEEEPAASTAAAPKAAPHKNNNEAKVALMDLIQEIDRDEERLPCGLEANEKEEELVQKIVTALEQSPNIIQETNGNLEPDDLIGDWKLRYCSSAAVKFNKGLSGIGGSFPNGKFGGLTQRLLFSRFKQDVEYTEQIDVNPDTASFAVDVNGAWELRKSISLFTNQPCTMLYVEPDRVKYGPTSTRADHWKSLGPMNMLDVTYLDEDLRIMRGNTATDSIFVFERI